MAATLKWENSNGASPSWVQDTYLRLKAADDNVNDNNDPLQHPGASSIAYSFEKALRINVTVAAATEVSNLRVKASTASPQIEGTPAVGLSMDGGFNQTYVEPVGTNSTIAVDFALDTSEEDWEEGGTTPISAKSDTGQWGDFFYMQLDIDGDDAISGTIDTFQITAVWDEI